MTLKVKLLSTPLASISDLEKELNRWLDVNSDYSIQDVKVSMSDHNVLMTVLYTLESQIKSSNVEQSNQPLSFKETLSRNSLDEPESSFSNQGKPAAVPPGIDFVSAPVKKNVKPGKFVQNNYNKYTKSNQKVSEDEAFDWN